MLPVVIVTDVYMHPGDDTVTKGKSKAVVDDKVKVKHAVNDVVSLYCDSSSLTHKHMPYPGPSRTTA